jgi:hypothetical protein
MPTESVGDHQRILTVACFYFYHFLFFAFPLRFGLLYLVNHQANPAQRLREITDPTTSPSAIKDSVAASSASPSNTVSSSGSILEAPSRDIIYWKPWHPPLVTVLLHGSTVDYTTELIGSQFKIVDNPRATSNCGCGNDLGLAG